MQASKPAKPGGGNGVKNSRGGQAPGSAGQRAHFAHQSAWLTWLTWLTPPRHSTLQAQSPNIRSHHIYHDPNFLRRDAGIRSRPTRSSPGGSGIRAGPRWYFRGLERCAAPQEESRHRSEKGAESCRTENIQYVYSPFSNGTAGANPNKDSGKGNGGRRGSGLGRGIRPRGLSCAHVPTRPATVTPCMLRQTLKYTSM